MKSEVLGIAIVLHNWQINATIKKHLSKRIQMKAGPMKLNTDKKNLISD